MITLPRVRFVVPRYGEEVVGGAESLVRRLATRLAGEGTRADVWTSCAVDATTWGNVLPPGWSRDAGVSVQRFPAVVRRHPEAFHQASRVMWRLPSPVRPERLWIVAQGPWLPRLVGALALAEPMPTIFVPYLYHPILRGLPRTPGPRILLPAAHDEGPLRLHAVGRCVAAADGLWYSTPEERTLMERAHPGAGLRPSAVGTVGIDPPTGADPARFRAAQGVRGPYLLYGGRAATGKGIDELLIGVAELRRHRPEVGLVLTGEATAPAGIPGVWSLGRLPEQQRIDAIAGATAVVVPSRHESLSLLALEAWALARPTLLHGGSTVLAGQSSRSGGGLVWSTPAELSAATQRLLDDEGLGARLGESGRRHVLAWYRWEAVIDRLVSLIAAAAARAAAR